LVETPWIITVRTGQRINVTLEDFTAVSGGQNSTGQSGGYNLCKVYSIIKDTGNTKSFTFCGGMVDKDREGIMTSYLSDSNSIEVRLPGVKANRDSGASQFLLHYEGECLFADLIIQ